MFNKRSARNKSKNDCIFKNQSEKWKLKKNKFLIDSFKFLFYFGDLKKIEREEKLLLKLKNESLIKKMKWYFFYHHHLTS